MVLDPQRKTSALTQGGHSLGSGATALNLLRDQVRMGSRGLRARYKLAIKRKGMLGGGALDKRAAFCPQMACCGPQEEPGYIQRQSLAWHGNWPGMEVDGAKHCTLLLLCPVSYSRTLTVPNMSNTKTTHPLASLKSN